MRLEEIPTPALLLDLDRLDANIGRMAAKAARLDVNLRPHIKTHKSVDIGRRQLAAGATGIAVATLEEARAFAAAGFDDITWAFPLIPDRTDEVVELARRVRLAVLVDSSAAIERLEAAADPLRVFLKVDCGYHRAGVSPTSATAVELVERLHDSATLSFGGLLTHGGHAYDSADPAGTLSVAHQERDIMVELAARLRNRGLDVPVVSIGSTPTLSVIDTLDGIDEIRPGNYVFYDQSQVLYGSCDVSDCALTVLASVVSSQPGSRHSVVDAGALALSRDAGPTHLGYAGFGRLYDSLSGVRMDPRNRVIALSQEHGKIDVRLPVGCRVRILPNHSCLTAAQFDRYHVVKGAEVVDRWPIARQR